MDHYDKRNAAWDKLINDIEQATDHRSDTVDDSDARQCPLRNHPSDRDMGRTLFVQDFGARLRRTLAEE
jgi:hypothetical protein